VLSNNNTLKTAQLVQSV